MDLTHKERVIAISRNIKRMAEASGMDDVFVIYRHKSGMHVADRVPVNGECPFLTMMAEAVEAFLIKHGTVKQCDPSDPGSQLLTELFTRKPDDSDNH